MVLIRSVTSADGAVVTGQIRIKKLVWDVALAADTLTLQDSAANAIITLNGGAATSTLSVDFNDEGLFMPSGHKVSQISANGKLFIYGD